MISVVIKGNNFFSFSDEKQHQRTTVESEDIAGEAHPVERIVEARSTEDSMASMVRSVYFADTFIVSGKFLCCGIYIHKPLFFMRMWSKFLATLLTYFPRFLLIMFV